MPLNSEMRVKTIGIIYRIAENVRFWKISCNMEDEAAEVAYNTIFNVK